MIRNIATNEELDSYSEEEEEKDDKKFSTLIKSLSNPQIEYLLSLILNEYSQAEISYLLDSALDASIKEELSDLWTFRTAHGIGR